VLKAQGFAAALQAIASQAKDVDANTMSLQYLDALREVGSSPSTKFVLPMELTSMAQQLMTAMAANNPKVPPAE
jgi:hypothetical protein